MKYKKKYDKKYYIKNKERILLRCKKNYIKNKERILKKGREYYQKNKKIINKRKRNYQKLYCSRNKEKILKWAKKARMKRRDKFNKYIRDRLKTDINFKLRKTIRARIRLALKNDKKRSKTLKLLGVNNIITAKKHLEKLFKPRMTWKNHGKWHIDHIIPCSSFDLTKASEQRECFHYTNLQPLWASENLAKGSKIS
jgi:hypothetical protein